jgi:hypothetical protein
MGILYLSLLYSVALHLQVFLADPLLQLLHVLSVSESHDVAAHEPLQAGPHERMAETGCKD